MWRGGELWGRGATRRMSGTIKPSTPFIATTTKPIKERRTFHYFSAAAGSVPQELTDPMPERVCPFYLVSLDAGVLKGNGVDGDGRVSSMMVMTCTCWSPVMDSPLMCVTR